MARFLDSLKETVTINGEGSQEITIMEVGKANFEAQGYILQDANYLGFISPPNFDLKINDLLTRQPRTEEMERGSSSGQYQVLTIQAIEVVGQKQQLLLKDRDRSVR